jgi:hypothetical protein
MLHFLNKKFMPGERLPEAVLMPYGEQAPGGELPQQRLSLREPVQQIATSRESTIVSYQVRRWGLDRCQLEVHPASPAPVQLQTK